MGDPSNVPAGKYGKAALETLGLWGEVKKNAVFTENVRLALQYVVLGEVKAAIVYASDRMAAPELKEAYRFPASSHAPILSPAALIENNASDQARAFLLAGWLLLGFKSRLMAFPHIDSGQLTPRIPRPLRIT